MADVLDGAQNDNAVNNAATDPQNAGAADRKDASQADANATGQQGSQQQTAGADNVDTGAQDGASAASGFLGKDTKEGEGDAGGDNKPASNAGVQPYDISYPEGFIEDKETVETVTPVLRSLGATQEQAQQLFDAGCKLIARIQDNVLTQAHEQESRWIKELSADADFGGDKLEESKGAVKAFVKRFAGGDASKVIELLDGYAISANPLLFKMFARAGAALAQEGKFVQGSSAGGAKLSDDELARKMFPLSMTQE